jgi:DNA-binding PadR family transcriptional regulator
MLALLSEGPKYGLQLREEFEARTGEVWPLNVGQVYMTLQRLERDGLVESEGDSDGEGPQKAYRITEAGARDLDAWLRTPPDLSSPPRDELVMKILVALRVPNADMPGIIQAHRRYLVQLMQQWTHIKEESDPGELSLGLAVDAEIFRLDSVVRWLDAADVRIKRAVADAGTATITTPNEGGDASHEQAQRPLLQGPLLQGPLLQGPLLQGPLPRLRGNKEVRTRR